MTNVALELYVLYSERWRLPTLVSTAEFYVLRVLSRA